MKINGDINSFWILKNISVLNQLSSNELESFHQCTKMKSFSKKKMIYLPRDKADKIYFLKEGKVKINSYSKEGKELIHAIITPGEIFGEMAAVGEKERDEYAEAIDASIICFMHVNKFSDLLNKIPSLNNELTKLIGYRLMKTRNRLERLWFLSAKERIILLLKDLSKEHGQLVTNGITVNLFLTHQDMAALASSSRQTVTSILSELESYDLIKYNRNQILLKNAFFNFNETKQMIG